MVNHDNLHIAAMLLILANVIGIVAVVFNLCGWRIPDKPTTPTAGGCPLDAVSYDAPVWMPECVRCQRVTDRITGKRWWLLTMSDGSHAVLPIDDAEVGK